MAAKSNIIHFLSDGAFNHLYFERTQQYLQPNFVFYNFYADTSEAFDEITRHPEGRWNLLFVDTQRLKTDLASVQKFQQTHQSCSIVVLGEQTSAVLQKAIFKDVPDDLDNWLSMMHSLLSDR
jgi:hypothetical protein